MTFPFPFIGAVSAKWYTLVEPTLTADASGWANYTTRTIIDKSVFGISIPASKMIMHISASNTTGTTLTKLFVGHAAATGDAYDFESEPTQLLTGGSPSAVMGAGGSAIFEGNFAFNPAKNLIVSAHCSSNYIRRRPGPIAGYTNYYKAGDDAATVNATGYTANGNAGAIYSFTKIEVLG